MKIENYKSVVKNVYDNLLIYLVRYQFICDESPYREPTETEKAIYAVLKEIYSPMDDFLNSLK